MEAIVEYCRVVFDLFPDQYQVCVCMCTVTMNTHNSDADYLVHTCMCNVASTLGHSVEQLDREGWVGTSVVVQVAPLPPLPMSLPLGRLFSLSAECSPW